MTQNCPRRSMSVIKSCQTANFELKCISSAHDYCNRLLMGTSNSVIQPLQKIQNFAARLVLLAPRHQHGTGFPFENALSTDKVACVCFKAINGSGPAYLSATATCLHSVLLLTHACRKSNNTNTRLTRGFRTYLALPDLTFGIHSHKTTLLNPVIFQSQTENLPLLTVFSPQLISVPSFCYSNCCPCVIVIARYTVSFEK